MPLPILSSPPVADLLRLFHRAELHFAQHLGESQTLDAGTAIVGHTRTATANAIFEAAVPPGASARETIELVGAHFAEYAAVCGTWALNPAAPASATTPLADALIAAGATAVMRDVLYLRQPALPVAIPPGLTIIPARASFRHAESLAALAAAETGDAPTESAAADRLAHLDDGHWDALLALHAGDAVGTVGVLAVGDLGLVAELFVAPAARRRKLGSHLVDRALEIAARSLFKHVFAAARTGDASHRLLLDRGFIPIGQETRYVFGMGSI